MFASSSLFAYNLDRKTTRLEVNNTGFPYARKLDLSTTSVRLMQANGSFQITGGARLPTDTVCRNLSIPGTQFSDMFSWAAIPSVSVFVGHETIDDRPCDRWRLNTTKTLTELSLCADGDVPVQLTIRSAVTANFSFNYTFGNLTAVGRDVDQSLFDVPATCYGFAPPCHPASGPTNLEAYVLHPGMSAKDYDIADQDVADLAGDAMFICSDVLNPAQKPYIDHNYTRVSRYMLLVSPSFGQYGLCNGYPDTFPPGPTCMGGDARLVGREAPLFAGEGELRCAAESPIGFWYSLPRMGQCDPGESPGTGAWLYGCTWSIQRRLKTIDQDCLLKEQRLPEKCEADFKAGTGFRLTAQALELAFASENVSAGGCPDIGEPPHEEAAVIV